MAVVQEGGGGAVGEGGESIVSLKEMIKLRWWSFVRS